MKSRLRIIPVLLMDKTGLYKGAKFKNRKYVGDPMNTVRIFNNKNTDELFLLDFTAWRENRLPDPAFIQKVADEAYMPFGVGGGIRTLNDIQLIIRAGAEKVSINTAAIHTPQLISEASELFGSQAIVVSIDVARDWRGKYIVFSHSGTKKTRLDPLEWALKAESLGAGELLINSIDRDGTKIGFDCELIKSITSVVKIPVVACGGAGNESHFHEVFESGNASAAAAGSFFIFQGKLESVLINYPFNGKYFEK